MVSLEKRTALVTGSSRGIGRQIAFGLAQLGCNIVLHGRNERHLDEVEEPVRSTGVKVYRATGELDSEDGIRSVIKGVLDGPGQVDSRYNTAAIMNPWTAIPEIPLPTWFLTLQVNLFAIVSLCNAFIPGMKEQGFGRIVNLTSGIKETPHLAPYGVSKAAVDKYTQELATSCRGTNVLVNCLDPGWLKTDLGGPNADFPVETVLPGALVPALLEDNGPSGRIYSAQDFKYLDSRGPLNIQFCNEAGREHRRQGA